MRFRSISQAASLSGPLGHALRTETQGLGGCSVRRIETRTVGSRRLAGWQALIGLLDTLPLSQRAQAWDKLWGALGDAETRMMLAETLGDGWRWPLAVIRPERQGPQDPRREP